MIGEEQYIPRVCEESTMANHCQGLGIHLRISQDGLNYVTITNNLKISVI